MNVEMGPVEWSKWFCLPLGKRETAALYFALLLGVLFSLTGSVAAETAEPSLERAAAFLQDKNYTAAIAEYQTIITMDPARPEAYRGLVQASQGQDGLRTAVIFMEGVFLEHSELAEVNYGLGLVYFASGKYDQALHQFEQAVERKADFAEALNNCGVIHQSVGQDMEKARLYYEMAVAAAGRTGNTQALAVAGKNLAALPSRAGGKKQEAETALILADFLAREFKRGFNENSLSDRLDAFLSRSTGVMPAQADETGDYGGTDEN